MGWSVWLGTEMEGGLRTLALMWIKLPEDDEETLKFVHNGPLYSKLLIKLLMQS